MSLVERTKKANWVENVMLPLNRYGYMEECYFTYSYSPLVSDNGSVEGLFTAVTETTTRVITERQTRCVGSSAIALGLVCFSFSLSLTHGCSCRTIRDLSVRGEEACTLKDAVRVIQEIVASTAKYVCVLHCDLRVPPFSAFSPVSRVIALVQVRHLVRQHLHGG